MGLGPGLEITRCGSAGATFQTFQACPFRGQPDLPTAKTTPISTSEATATVERSTASTSGTL